MDMEPGGSGTTPQPAESVAVSGGNGVAAIAGQASAAPNILIKGHSIAWGNSTVRLPTEVLQGYRIIRAIGEGTYGKVFLAQVINPDLPGYDPAKQISLVAIKVLPLTRRSEGVPPTTIREVALLRELNHFNVVKLFNIHIGADSIALVFEMCKTEIGHLLDSHIKSDGFLGRAYVRNLLFQILRGLYYIHSEGVLHRDIKPQNILLTDDYQVVKIADFGLSRTFGLSPEHEQKNCTAITLWYRPPEVLLGQSYYSTAAEVWSVGCLFAELLATRTILNGQTEVDQLRKIFWLLDVPPNIRQIFPEVDRLPFLWEAIRYQGPRLRDLLHKVADPYAADLLLKMLAINPTERITVLDALRHSYFSDSPAAKLIHSFVPTVAPSTFAGQLNGLVPKLRQSDVGTAHPVDAIYRAEVARLARKAARQRLQRASEMTLSRQETSDTQNSDSHNCSSSPSPSQAPV